MVSRWVRQNFGLLMTLALCLVAAWPLLKENGIMWGHDSLLHAYRVGELNRSWSHGILFPRWAETFYYGYGSPVFQYYTPLAYYWAAFIMRIIGLEIVGAIRLLLVMCFLGMGVGMYLFARHRSGTLGGVIAAVCYVFSPYLLFTEPYTRGDYPELLCFTIFPFVMWRFDCVLSRGKSRDVILAAFSLTLMLLSHNLMAVVLSALLVGWLGVEFLAQRRIAYKAILAVGFGVLLSAFFWLPVLLERDAVQFTNVLETIGAEIGNFSGFFIPLKTLFGFTSLTDVSVQNGILLRHNLGVAQWLLAFTGLLGLIFFKNLNYQNTETTKRKFLSLITHYSSLYFALVALVMIFVMSPLAYPLWEGISLFKYLLFPWRLLGPVAFCLAVLSGMNALWIEQFLAEKRRLYVLVSVILLILPILLAFPILYVPNWRDTSLNTSVSAYLDAEMNRKTSPGTTAYNEFLPETVFVMPGATLDLVGAYASRYPPDKANRASLPEDSEISLIEHSPEHDIWQISTSEPTTLEVMTFYFSGWQAEIDGQPVPIIPSNPHGFITIPIPAGEHTLRLFLGTTPARDIGSLLSLVGMIGLIAYTVVMRRNRLTIEPESSPELMPYVILPLTIAGLVILSVLFMREGVAWMKSPAGEALTAQYPVKFDLVREDRPTLKFLGYDLSSDTLRPGDWLELVVYWSASEPIPYNYQSFVHVSSGGPPSAQADKPNPAGSPTTQWSSEGYLRDEYVIHLPETMPAGEYQLLVGLYTCETMPAGECGNGDRLQVIDSARNPIGDAVPIARITIR